MSKTQDTTITFDMRFHAFVLAVPRRGDGVGQPAIAMNGGDEQQLVFALRAIADDIEAHGTDTLPLS